VTNIPQLPFWIALVFCWLRLKSTAAAKRHDAVVAAGKTHRLDAPYIDSRWPYPRKRVIMTSSRRPTLRWEPMRYLWSRKVMITVTCVYEFETFQNEKWSRDNYLCTWETLGLFGICTSVRCELWRQQLHDTGIPFNSNIRPNSYNCNHSIKQLISWWDIGNLAWHFLSYFYCS